MQEPLTDVAQIRWLPLKNVSGERIPPFGVMRIICFNADGLFEVGKPNADSVITNIAFNGAIEIPVDGTGQGTAEFPNWAAYQSADYATAYDSRDTANYDPYYLNVPECEDEWGPKADSWYLSQECFGFKISGVDTERKIVMAMPIPGGFGSLVAVTLVKNVCLLVTDS